jgi:hypothetical protein
MLLSRPPAFLPGNLAGIVTNGQGVGIPNVTITATAGAVNLSTTSGAGGAYTMATTQGGAFQMVPGDYTITARRTGFSDYTSPGLVTINPNATTRFDFAMQPAPAPATITVRWINRNGGPVPNAGNNATFFLYQNGQERETRANVARHGFIINFTNTNPQRFTVATDFGLFQRGFIGQDLCSTDQGRLNFRGWTSADLCAWGWDPDGNASVNRWRGAGGRDNIEVNPGDNVTIDIPVQPVPMTMLSGTIRVNPGQILRSPRINILWTWFPSTLPVPAPGNWLNQFAQRDWVGPIINNEFAYNIPVPAIQAMLPNQNGHFLLIRPTTGIGVQGCCDNIFAETGRAIVANDTERTPGRQHPDGWVRVGPLFEGIPAQQDFLINAMNQVQACGGLQGTTNVPATVVVNNGVGNIPIGTPGNTGYQTNVCANNPGNPYSLGAADYEVLATANNFYDYTTRGNDFYTRWGSGAVRVDAQDPSMPQGINLTRGPDIRLLPRGFGTMTITVVRGGGAFLGAGTTVQLAGPSVRTGVTDANGQVTFANIPETWPSPAARTSPEFNTTTIRNYTITATRPVFRTAERAGVTLNAGEQGAMTIELIPVGGI